MILITAGIILIVFGAYLAVGGVFLMGMARQAHRPIVTEAEATRQARWLAYAWPYHVWRTWKELR